MNFTSRSNKPAAALKPFFTQGSAFSNKPAIRKAAVSPSGRLNAPSARIKPKLDEIKARADLPARITSRVEEVVANVRRHAEAQGLPPDLVEKLWRRLIDWSIAREESMLGPDSLREEPKG